MKKFWKADGRFPCLTAVFFLLLFGFSFLNLFAPRQVQLEMENRMAAQFIPPTADTVLNGTWMAHTEECMEDQLLLRNCFIDLQCFVDETFLQKTEMNGILLGKNGWMFTKQLRLSDTEAQALEKNVGAVERFAENSAVPVTFLLAPSASLIYPEMLPAYSSGERSPLLDENALLDEIFARLQMNMAVVDLRECFRANKQEYLYYKTDHHWTTLGAGYAYQQFCIQKGLEPILPAPKERIEVPGFYGTHYTKTRCQNAESDTLFYYPGKARMTVYDVISDAQFSENAAAPLIAAEKLDTHDKYSAFLGGNHGYAVIQGKGYEGSILVVKDSYANCLVPYLTENYQTVGVVDYRNYAYGLNSLIENEGYDEVLILYCVQSFLTDTRIPMINRPPAAE